ncbi:MAG: hypothetical protein LBN10_05245, partial [Propionibacteriaceae bacterium]|nr:hypothetical protein [Propionibacteriaceae bacterium]
MTQQSYGGARSAARDGFVFFDVETPNRRNDRICSIGLVYVDPYGGERWRQHLLIDPGVGFDPVNVSIHGITPSAVAGQPRFMDVWGSGLAEVFSSAIAIAHNAAFDLSVLAKTLAAYELEMPDITYDDTLVLSRTFLPAIGNYRLPDVCSALGIPMGRHHDALSDTLACRAIFQELDARFGVSATCGKFYETGASRNASKHSTPSTSTVTAINDLYGRVMGIRLDHVLFPEEMAAFTDWVDTHRHHREEPFLSQCFNVVEGVLSDGVLTADEANRIMEVTSPFIESDEATATIAQETVRFLGLLRGIAADRRLQDMEIE